MDDVADARPFGHEQEPRPLLPDLHVALGDHDGLGAARREGAWLGDLRLVLDLDGQVAVGHGDGGDTEVAAEHHRALFPRGAFDIEAGTLVDDHACRGVHFQGEQLDAGDELHQPPLLGRRHRHDHRRRVRRARDGTEPGLGHRLREPHGGAEVGLLELEHHHGRVERRGHLALDDGSLGNTGHGRMIFLHRVAARARRQDASHGDRPLRERVDAPVRTLQRRE